MDKKISQHVKNVRHDLENLFIIDEQKYKDKINIFMLELEEFSLQFKNYDNYFIAYNNVMAPKFVKLLALLYENCKMRNGSKIENKKEIKTVTKNITDNITIVKTNEKIKLTPNEKVDIPENIKEIIKNADKVEVKHSTESSIVRNIAYILLGFVLAYLLFMLFS